MLFLLFSVYLSAASCISEEINLDPCWHRDILRVKGRAQIKNLLCVSWRNQYAIIKWPLFDTPTSTSGGVASFSLYISAVDCTSEDIKLGPCWRKDILRVKGQAKFTKCYFFESAKSIRTHSMATI